MQEECTKLDFTGQQVYVGLDVGKKSWKVSIYVNEHYHKTFSQPPRPEVLSSYLRRMFPKAEYQCAYEAGYFGFWIRQALINDGVNCMVVNPADVPTTHKEHTVKTDRVDARKLARSLRAGELQALYVPSTLALEARSLVRTRAGVVRKQTRCKNQIKAYLEFYGLMPPSGLEAQHWSRRYIQHLHDLQQSRSDQSLYVLLRELVYLREVLADVTKAVRDLAWKEPYATPVALLLTIPGIGLVTAMTLATELVTIDRFRQLDHLASFVGLVPGEHSSGEMEKSTSLTPRHNRALRSMLIEAAWIAVREDPALLKAFADLCKRMPKSKAIVRIARKLLNRIRFVLKNQQPYVVRTVTEQPVD